MKTLKESILSNQGRFDSDAIHDLLKSKRYVRGWEKIEATAESGILTLTPRGYPYMDITMAGMEMLANLGIRQIRSNQEIHINTVVQDYIKDIQLNHKDSVLVLTNESGASKMTGWDILAGNIEINKVGDMRIDKNAFRSRWRNDTDLDIENIWNWNWGSNELDGIKIMETNFSSIKDDILTGLTPKKEDIDRLLGNPKKYKDLLKLRWYGRPKIGIWERKSSNQEWDYNLYKW